MGVKAQWVARALGKAAAAVAFNFTGIAHGDNVSIQAFPGDHSPTGTNVLSFGAATHSVLAGQAASPPSGGSFAPSTARPELGRHLGPWGILPV